MFELKITEMACFSSDIEITNKLMTTNNEQQQQQEKLPNK